MNIRTTSHFKDPEKDFDYFRGWVQRLEALNKITYKRINIRTSLGNTVVWSINADKSHLKTILIFPGFRTCSLFWDFDRALDSLREEYRIFLIDTNGQPCLSDGNTPDIKSEDYGWWANDVMEKLGVSKAIVAGASFGGLVCMKLCIVAPEKIEKVFLLNPGCLQTFSLSIRNLYYNLLPIISPTRKNVGVFLDNAVFCKPNHQLSPEAETLIIDYEVFALSRFVDKAQKPYRMTVKELARVTSEVYLLEGDKDLLFPFEKSVAYAQKCITNLKKVFVLKDTGHGIETSREAIKIISEVIANKGPQTQ